VGIPQMGQGLVKDMDGQIRAEKPGATIEHRWLNRRRAAVVVELANAACATVHWMVPRPPL